jgi:diguanylate cyclase (GGDEF)-like protein
MFDNDTNPKGEDFSVKNELLDPALIEDGHKGYSFGPENYPDDLDIYGFSNESPLNFTEASELLPRDHFLITKISFLINQLIDRGLVDLAQSVYTITEVSQDEFLSKKENPTWSFYRRLLEYFKTDEDSSKEERQLELFFFQTISLFQLESTLASVENLSEKYQGQSVTDVLTGVFNRRKFEEDLAANLEKQRKEDKNMSLVLFDIDHFKNFNDTFGHDAGDIVLKELSKVVQSVIREDTDDLYRTGGEEFHMILRSVTEEEAKIIAEKVMDKVREMEFEFTPISGGVPRRVKLTISIGMVSRNYMENEDGHSTDEPLDIDHFIKTADNALYWVKETTRDAIFQMGVDNMEKEKPTTINGKIREMMLGLKESFKEKTIGFIENL